ncbi:MAG: M48 family metallopeptidase [Gammaproteobacteria bacterium]|nr:M48 family metallopeptidase [Gammaproteobacteria bacterium]MCP5200327.1 M48 family metallopeptidase [Gammaproteobacteria bacterium]
MTSLSRSLCAGLLCTLAACATSPTGRTQFLAFSEQNAIAASKQAYTEMITPLANENRINTDAKLNARVKRIVDRLVPQAIAMRPDTAGWDWTMTVIDDPETVNAWAMAGGKMALYTGLIKAIAPTDDELAQVLGHEIAHALAKHSVEKMSVAAIADAGVKTVGIATDSALAMQGSALVAALAVTLPNSRSMESEADRIGIELAARAGYDPAAAVTLWDKMAAVGGARTPQFLSTHPNPAARKTALEALVPQMRPLYEQARH